MPLTFKKPLPSVTNKTAGNTAILDLPTGNLRYHKILLALTSGMTAITAVSDIIDEIRIKLDGRVVRRLLGDQIDYLINFNGDGFSSTLQANGFDRTLMLHFAEMWRRTADGEDALAWGMSDVGNFQIEIDIASGATNLDFTGFSEVDYVVSDIGVISKVSQQTVPASGAGKHSFPTLPKNLPYTRMHCFSDKVDSIRVTVNGEIVYELKKEEAVCDQTIAGLNPTATVFTVPFDQRQRVNDYLDVRGASEFTLEFEMASGAVPFQLVYEQVGPVNG